MALSNTATPYYYGQFRDAVIRGDRPVCKELAQQMARIDEKIANPAFYYDNLAVEGFIQYCEQELTLVDGGPVHMLDEFKLWAEDLFGWYYFVERSVFVPDENGPGGHYEIKKIKRRLTNKQVIILGRGGAKSMYGSFIHSYFLNCDTTTTYQIVTAPTMRQAEETLSPIRTAIINARGPLFKFLTEGSLQNTTGNKLNRQKLASTKKGIENFLTGSLIEIRPLSVDKLQGLRCKVAVLDEWLSGDIREDPIGAIEQSASKIPNYIIVAISSEGTVRNGPGDTIKMELRKILRGEYYNPHVSIFYYKLDDVSEVANPAMWIKAQPNIGKTVSYETYQLEVERMEHNPSTRNDTLAKRFGIEMEGYTYYFSYEETKPHPQRFYNGMPCALGADMSQGDDFCSFTFLFPLGQDTFGVKTRNYITEDKYAKLQPAMRTKYDEFIQEGTLIVMPGITLGDLNDVYEDLDRYIDEMQYDVRALGYDPYNAKVFIDRWMTENGPFGIEKVQQGSRTESVPLGELKHLSENGLLWFDESIMGWAIGNCVVITDTNGNRKLYKLRNSEKIDPVAALMDAYIAWKSNADAFG